MLPSLHEGLSIAALEAIRANVPILMSDIKPNLDIGLRENHYFKAGSAEQLAGKLGADLSTYAVGGGFDVSRFDWSEIARETLREVDAVTRGRRPAKNARTPRRSADRISDRDPEAIAVDQLA